MNTEYKGIVMKQQDQIQLKMKLDDQEILTCVRFFRHYLLPVQSQNDQVLYLFVI